MEGTGAGALGPRLAGRLTAELILRSPQYMSCIKQYEIDLRGNKISAIENLGATENQFDSIDLSDNAIVLLEGFPKLPKLKTLLLNNNRIARIGRSLDAQLPGLETVVLTNNRISRLVDLDPLSTIPKLKYLSLLDNVVTKEPNYRLYVVHKCPGLKVLDFKKVKQKEREAAARLYGSSATDREEAAQPLTFEPEEDLAAAEASVRQQQEPEGEMAGKGPTQEQLLAIKAAIANAQTLEEVQRLESALKTGHLPSEITIGSDAAPAAANGGATAMEEG